MKQTDNFGQFNCDIQAYNPHIAAGIACVADRLRDRLERLSIPERNYYDYDGAVREMLEGYRQLVHMIRSLKHI